jgi:glycine dehydrogenase
MNTPTQTNPREFNPFYLGTSDQDIKEMLAELGLTSLEELYQHIPDSCKMDQMELPPFLERESLKKHLEDVSNKNKQNLSFLGDGLQDFKIPEIVPKVCNIRGLTTAYTPYQPERSQGTLQTLWIYQSAIAQITGFEAINASLYERATCLFEALNCATRIARKKNTVIVASNIYPGDIEVLKTQSEHTGLNILFAPIDTTTGKLDHSQLEKLIQSNEDVCAVAFAQINNFGLIEDFDALNDLVHQNNLLAIGMVDPIALANNGLKEPAKWGKDQAGADILVAEGQHLTLDANYGGPGLGIFGIRFNEKNKTHIRATAGRFIGKAKDEHGRECKAIILSTREQHIRREKATSNICSNQSFVASACGAALLNKGDKGLATSFETAHSNALRAAKELAALDGVEIKFSGSFFNEFTLKLNESVEDFLNEANQQGINAGINVSGRNGIDEQLLLVSFSDKHSDADVDKLINFFKNKFQSSEAVAISDIAAEQKRSKPYRIPHFPTDAIETYYQKLGKQNLSPDEGLYPLGSCTMKYNPEINDWAASLPGFTHCHPQAPINDVQGNLEVLFQVQEQFKAITGLPGVTTQPVAGAQGELVGLKLFQAYHQDRGEGDQRNIVIIPRSAHGTNPATATMAGFETKKVDGKPMGIVTIEALPTGEMNFDQLKQLISDYADNIAGVMVTNPNTAGIFEGQFKAMSELIHNAGGLVYMDGANMNAIAGWIDLGKLGVDAVHNNLHKTWSIPHGGGGPGDAIVAVSEKLIPFLPGHQIEFKNGNYSMIKPAKSIGSFHRHHGNFAHKVRTYTYLRALGTEGIKKMSAVAVLSARYLYKKLKDTFPVLPAGSDTTPRMHEFILTLSDATFDKVAQAGTPKAQTIAKVGKLFLDFGFHAPTVAFPEVYGLMLEPTESYSKAELDGFCEVVKGIHQVIEETPEVLTTVPHFTPVDKVDEVSANKIPVLNEEFFNELPEVLDDRVDPDKLRNMPLNEIKAMIKAAHEEQK